MLGNLDKLAKIITLLVASYNPHVRYGAGMALGIACHARPSSVVIGILEPMLKDPSDIVR
jgi:26S proteasome regulatory subunit N2